MVLVQQGAKVSPVDLKPLAGCGLHPHKGPSGGALATDSVQMFLQNAHAAIETQRAEPLSNDGGTECWILREPFGDGRLEGVQFAGALSWCRP